MDREALAEVMQKSRELIAAPTCSSETKAAAQRWLSMVGTDREREETEKYFAELEEDIMPIDSLIAFAQSAQGAGYFGAQEIKANGARYCDCPACAIVEEILANKVSLL